jgi:hypothetical protein
MTLRRLLQHAWQPAPADPLEASIQRLVFAVVAGFLLVLCVVYGTLLTAQGKPVLGGSLVVLLAATLGCAAWMRFSGRTGGALGGLMAVVFGVLSYVTLHQPASLPAAGWWLSIVPFVLAGAGMFRTAIGSVFAFIAIVTWLQFSPVPPFEVESDIPPWRRYSAVAGSELVALSLIVIAMRRRSQVAQALRPRAPKPRPQPPPRRVSWPTCRTRCARR